MRRLSVLKLATSVIAAGAAFASHGASAREITDWEASKLTLDALTATPVYHRPAVSHSHHGATVHQVASHRSVGQSRSALVHTVVYHAKAPASAKGHHARRHG
ncbi:hypothetical protein C0V97_07255 [Asaia sp. W19]|uniref:hypothetical protein n=1 Tax=unclassified Asaia TaxID=2685023 RepID=UPI000F8D33B5|nr:hypothetical protein [Asaia sp. W19]RUT26171.1 hypothetical protein C0V97_07255 [Asaia sp. W19]